MFMLLYYVVIWNPVSNFFHNLNKIIHKVRRHALKPGYTPNKLHDIVHALECILFELRY